jgi:hypothetical protein
MECMARILSLILVGFDLVVAYALNRVQAMQTMIPIIVFGPACIWYGDALGGVTGFRWFYNINVSRTSPGGFLRFLGREAK